MKKKLSSKKCPLCSNETDVVFKPFCSKRCSDVDLNRWLSSVYVVPTNEAEESDEWREAPPLSSQ